MRKTIAAGLPLVVLSVFACLATMEAAGAAPIRASLPSITETPETMQLVAQTNAPQLNGYRGESTRRAGYRQNSDGYWYPSRAFNGSNEFTGSIMRQPRLNDACNHGFTPTNGSSRCDY